MPVEFLTDDEAAAYGPVCGPPSQADLERVFFLDGGDLALAGRHRGEHIRAGFALRTRRRLPAKPKPAPWNSAKARIATGQ